MLCWSHGNKQTLSCLQNTMPKMDDGERRPLTSARKVTSQILQPSFLSRKYTETWKITMRSDIRMRKQGQNIRYQTMTKNQKTHMKVVGGAGQYSQVGGGTLPAARPPKRQGRSPAHTPSLQLCSSDFVGIDQNHLLDDAYSRSSWIP